jgi:hypothetical protein
MEMLLESTKKKKQVPRRPFKVRWAKLPRRWVEALCRSNSAGTYRLAHMILLEHTRQQLSGEGEVILSSSKTGMSRTTRKRAIRELVKLGLIRVKQSGQEAVRVTHIFN